MHLVTRSSITLIFMCCSCVSAVAQEDSLLEGNVKANEKWHGEVKIELRKEAPAKGYIIDKAQWEKFWKAYRGAEKLPEVNFDKELIVVAVGRDPNSLAAVLHLSGNGDLGISKMQTAIRFDNPKTCKYQIKRISRAGVKTVNGNAIDSK